MIKENNFKEKPDLGGFFLIMLYNDFKPMLFFVVVFG